MLRHSTHEIVAARIWAAVKTHRSETPIGAGEPDFDLGDAYRIAATIVERRTKGGEVPVGWKIGFTNRTIWDEFGVRAPIWGRMYDTTATAVDPSVPAACLLKTLVEPRIEPEIVFRVGSSPQPGMNEAELIACLDGVAHGYEMVQSIYPGWKFSAADTVAACGLHGRLFHGPFTVLDEASRSDWRARLAGFELALHRDGTLVDRGQGTDVLGGPLSALAHFVDGLDRVSGERLQAGEIVTTGTVTRALTVAPGETWRSEIFGLPLPGLTIRFE